jgi:hypothetical protein
MTKNIAFKEREPRDGAGDVAVDAIGYRGT